jgi:deoxyribonuclease-4
LSIAGGPQKALERAADHGFETVAIFVRNQRRWRARPLSEAAAGCFRKTRRRLGIHPVVAHGSYLANLAGRTRVRRRSMAAVADELDRCRRLGADYYVLHPGSPGQAGRDAGIARVADALNTLIAAAGRRVKLLLETTAGAGRQLGGAFEDLAEMLALLERPGRFGVCLDTCHVFAAGYDLRTPGAYRRTMNRFDRVVGLERLLVVHLSDSLAPLGSRRDRHEHIGRGRIGLGGFANLVNDRRLAGVPMILETPKALADNGRDWDRINAETLHALLE